MGWQTWLNLSVMVALATPNSFGSKAIQQLMDLGSINALDAIVLDLPMDHKIPHCQVCNKPLRRVFTAVPTIFRGTGWAGKDG